MSTQTSNSPFSFAEHVTIDRDASIIGTITGIMHRPGDRCFLEISYLHNGEPKSFWIQAGVSTKPSAVALDYRMVVDITRAERAKRHFPTPKPSNAAAKLGLRYERNVGKELTRQVTLGNFVKLEHNPWFTFYDKLGVANCSPTFSSILKTVLLSSRLS